MNQRIKALFFISRCLAKDPQPESIAALRTEILSGQLSWEAVVSLANGQLVTPALWAALKKKGLTEELPVELHDYLEELHQLNVERNAHLQTQLLEAVKKLNSINISPVLLKGALHLVTDMYGDPGARIMSDIDLLVPGEDTKRCMAALQELGYRAHEEKLDDYPEQHHHCPPLSRPTDYADIEIHRKLMEGYDDILSAETALAQAQPLGFQGHSMKVLSPTHRVLHNILHSQLVDRNYSEGMIPLRSLYEATTEDSASHGRPDWSIIRSRMELHNRGKVLRTYLYLAHRLFRNPLPTGFQKTPECWLFYNRCVAQLGWQSIEAWGIRLGSFSADNIRRVYQCKKGWIPVNLARLQHAKRRLASFATRMI